MPHDAVRSQISLVSPDRFLDVEGVAKIDDEHVSRDSRRAEVVLGMLDLRCIDTAPTPAAAREQDVLRGHVRSFVARRPILSGTSSFG
jgi:hypothetical protein